MHHGQSRALLEDKVVVVEIKISSGQLFFMSCVIMRYKRQCIPTEAAVIHA